MHILAKFSINEAEPQSRPVVLTVFTHIVHPSTLFKTNIVYSEKNVHYTTGETVGLAEWIIDYICLVSYFLVTNLVLARHGLDPRDLPSLRVFSSSRSDVDHCVVLQLVRAVENASTIVRSHDREFSVLMQFKKKRYAKNCNNNKNLASFI